jgi:hypothetical protein
MERATGDKRVEPSWLAASAILLTGILAAAEGARAAPTAGDALFIDAEGRVGIGTVEPGPALDVVGEVRACSGLAVGTGEAKAKVDIQDGERTGEHPAAVPGLYVTAPLEGARGIEFRRGDGS